MIVRLRIKIAIAIAKLKIWKDKMHRRIFKGDYCICGGLLHYDGYDGWIDRNIYKCEKCGRRWC